MVDAIWQSFYSASLYRQVRQWRGKAFLYLGLVLLVCWIPGMVKAHRLFSMAMQKLETEVAPKIPDIRFEKGKIYTPENRPYVYNFSDKDKTLGIIIDTSGKFTTLEGQNARILLTRDKLIVREKSGKITIHDLSLSKASPLIIDKAFKQKVFTMIRRWSMILLFPLILLASYLKRLFQAFLIALLGLAIVSILQAELHLGELFSIAMVAMTPAMILQTCWLFTPMTNRYSWLISAGLILAYFIYGINAASTKEPEAV